MPSLAKMKALLDEAQAAYKAKFTPGFYHATPANNIQVFDPASARKGEMLTTPGVSFFSPNPKFANDNFLPVGNKGFKQGATMYPVSINMGKHFDPTSPEAKKEIQEYARQRVAEEMTPEKIKNLDSIAPGYSDVVAKELYSTYTKGINTGAWDLVESPAFLEHLRNQKYDTFAVNELGQKGNVGVFEPHNIRGKFAEYNPDEAMNPDFMKAGGGSINSAIKLAKEYAPNFNLAAIRNMPVSSAQKQLPVANAFKALSAEHVDPKLKQQIFEQYRKTNPELVKKSGATNYDELTQAAYEKMAGETKDQFGALTGSGVKLSFDPTGEKGYKSSAEMLNDALNNKQLTVFGGGEIHPGLSTVDPKTGLSANQQFRAVHDYFGHGTTGSSFGPKGEELAYGAHSQMYSPLAKLAAAAETRGQNSFVTHSGINEDLINQMGQLKQQRDAITKAGGDPTEINNQLLKLGQQWQYAPQKPLILPPEQLDINYQGAVDHLAGGGIPEKIVKAYKLFKTNPKAPDELFPLFINSNESVPIGKWVDASTGPLTAAGKVKSNIGNLAYRPGWHAGDLPVATHIGGKSAPDLTAPDYRPSNQVWAEVEMPNDVDWQKVAMERAQRNKAGDIIPRTAHITDQLPEGGHYRYKTNPNMTGDWLIGGSMKVNKVLTDEEVRAINEAAGVADLPRFTKFDEKAAGGEVVKKALQYAKSVPFVHFSHSPAISQLEPSMYGTGIKGAEGVRLENAPDIKPRSYFYTARDDVRPETGLGSHKYSGVSESSYPLHQDPAGYYKMAKELAKDPYFAKQGVQIIDQPTLLNEVERAIKNAGYSGYHSDDAGIVFHPTSVTRVAE